MKNGMIISLEGTEGCGKTTQIQNLKTYFEQQGKQVHLFREPGTTSFGEKIREALLASKTPLDPTAQTLAFLAARAQLIVEKILPLKNSPNTVILLDRFLDSTVAYQGFAGGLGYEKIMAWHQDFPLNLRPDLTFYLKLDLATSDLRQQNREHKDYFETKEKDFFTQVIKGLDWCAANFPERIKTIDASLPVGQVLEQMKQFLR